MINFISFFFSLYLCSLLIFLFLFFLLFFLLLSFALFLATISNNFTTNLIIIDKHISNDLAISNIIIFLFNSNCSDKCLPTVLIFSLFFFDFSIGFLKMGQPL